MRLRNTNRTPGSTGLNIDGRFAAAAVVAGGRIEAAASVDLPEGVMVEGEVRDPLQLTESLKELFAAKKFPKSVRLGVSNQQMVVRQIELPRIEDPDECDAAVRFQAAEAIPMPLEEAVLDWVSLGESISPEGIARSRIVVVAARRSMIELLVESVRSAGLRPEGVDLDSFALVRALAMPDAEKESALVYCHLAGIVNLAIAVGDDCYFTRPIPRDWSSEEVDVAQSLAEEIRRSIDAYGLSTGAPPVAGIRLSGPGSALDDLSEQLHEATGLEVGVAPPFGVNAPAGVPSDEDPRRFTVAAGLSLGVAA